MDWSKYIPIIIFIGDVLLGLFCYWIGTQTVKPIKENNQKLFQEKTKLLKDCNSLSLEKKQIIAEKNIEQSNLEAIKKQKLDLLAQMTDIKNDILIKTESAENIAKAAYKNKYIELDLQFKKDKEKQNNKIELIKKQQEQLIQEKEEIQKELKSLKETRAAAISAAQQEKNISENKDFYCLILPPQDQSDIEILKNVIKKISKPRSILMAIWQAYYQPIAKKKFPQILGKSDVCGIYKITNQQTGECYIGQARDIRRRFAEHAKAGLGIDTPQGNQLYKAMLEYGLDIFSFELLLECKPEELNEKEKYFIELYNSDAIGYNISRGVN